jgi:hypothetical protein
MCEQPVKQPFQCPKCGSTEAEEEMLVEPISDEAPWSDVLHIITCAKCGAEIPAHLAECWGLTREEAQNEWQTAYRR